MPVAGSIRDSAASDADDAQGEADVVGVVAVERPVHRGPEVVELRTLPGPPGELVAAEEAGSGFLGPVGEVLGVATTPPVGVAVLVEAFAGVLAQGFEHLVAGRAVRGLFGDDHRLRHQLGERVEHIPGLDPVAGHDRLRRRGVEAAGEHAEPVEHRPFADRRAASTTSRPSPATSDGVPPPSVARR